MSGKEKNRNKKRHIRKYEKVLKVIPSENFIEYKNNMFYVKRFIDVVYNYGTKELKL